MEVLEGTVKVVVVAVSKPTSSGLAWHSTEIKIWYTLACMNSVISKPGGAPDVKRRAECRI